MAKQNHHVLRWPYINRNCAIGMGEVIGFIIFCYVFVSVICLILGADNMVMMTMTIKTNVSG